MMDACALCGSNSATLLCRKNGFDIFRCHACRLVRVAPLPSPEELEKYYREGYDQFRYSFSTPDAEPPARKTSELRLLERHCAPGKLLDVGCAFGHFLVNARAHGWMVSGIEPQNEARKESISRFGLDVVESLDNAPDGAFDAVTLWHVVEHVRTPVEFLRQCREKLAMDGVIAVATPNVGSLVAWATGESWGWLSPPDHLFLFSPETLPVLMRKAGFDVLEVRTRRGQSRNTLLLLLQAMLFRLGVLAHVKVQLEKSVRHSRGSPSVKHRLSIFWMVEKITDVVFYCFLPLFAVIWKLGYGDEVVAVARKKNSTT